MSYRRSSSRYSPKPERSYYESSSYGSNADDKFLRYSVKKDWSGDSIAPFKKNFYAPTEDVVNRSVEDVQSYRHEKSVSVQGLDIPNPFQSFLECNFPSEIFQCLAQAGFTIPTPIQGQGMPIVLRGQNLVGIAQTGSGKTLAYVLPALVHVMNQPNLKRGDGPMALIMAPTRELAQQIQQVLSLFQRYIKIRSAVIYGGAPKEHQLSWLERGVEVLIATPGRLIDFMDSNQIALNRVTFLVLDEADRMLDMGFKPQIKKVINMIRPDRQVLMWSATWPKEVKQMAAEFLSDYTHLCVGNVELSANQNILQIVDVCEESEKDFKLMTLLRDISSKMQNKTIIFVRTKRKVDEITSAVRRDGWPVAALHGNKNQGERDRVLRAFRNGSICVLVATDVAARGLDVQDVKYVINFDYPNSSEDYIHRIGRTGRNDNNGTSYAFFTRDNIKQVDSLIAVLRESNQDISPKLLEMSRQGRYGNNKKRNAGDDGGYSGASSRSSIVPYKRSRYESRDDVGNWDNAITLPSMSSGSSGGNNDRRMTKSRWDEVKNENSNRINDNYGYDNDGSYQATSQNYTGGYKNYSHDSSYYSEPQTYKSNYSSEKESYKSNYSSTESQATYKSNYHSELQTYTGSYQQPTQTYESSYQAAPKKYNSNVESYQQQNKKSHFSY